MSSDGVWFCYRGDWEQFVAFNDPDDAVKFMLQHRLKMVFVPFGAPVLEYVEDPETWRQLVEEKQAALDDEDTADDDGGRCKHKNTFDVVTMGLRTVMCNDCGETVSETRRGDSMPDMAEDQ